MFVHVLPHYYLHQSQTGEYFDSNAPSLEEYMVYVVITLVLIGNNNEVQFLKVTYNLVYLSNLSHSSIVKN